MDLRKELVRHRAALVKMRVKLKNKIHGILLLMKGVVFPSVRPFTREHTAEDEDGAFDDYYMI